MHAYTHTCPHRHEQINAQIHAYPGAFRGFVLPVWVRELKETQVQEMRWREKGNTQF